MAGARPPQSRHDPEDDDGIDEGPSIEDIERFSHGTGHCPDCGRECADDADVCPGCFAYLGGDTRAAPAVRREWSRRTAILIVIVVLASMAAGIGVIRLW
jgi:hypothetical protein